MSVDPAPRLFLITPHVADAGSFAPLLEAAVTAVDVACVLVRTLARDEGDAKAILRTLAPIAQRHDVAVLVEGQARLAAHVDADGVHIDGSGPALAEALAAMKPRRIVGCGPLASRDEAMAVGEAGVDYVLFGAPGDDAHAAVVERVAWWAEIFNVPCVGYAARPDLAREIAEAGAEFVALCGGVWDRPEQIADTLGAVQHAIAVVGLPT